MKTKPASSRKGNSHRIVIIGQGRFGTYFKNQLGRVGLSAQGFDLNPTQNELQQLKKATIVIFAVPIRRLEEAIKQFATHLPTKALIIDVCSVKVYPCHLLRTLKGKQRTLVGTHPLFGPQSAPESCAGQRVAVCPVRGSTRQAEALLMQLGLNIIRCTPHEHDKQMNTQMLNHFIGRTAQSCQLARVALSTKTHELFMNIVDIISGNSFDLFVDMNLFNPYARVARQDFIAKAQALDDMLTEHENSAVGQTVQRLLMS